MIKKSVFIFLFCVMQVFGFSFFVKDYIIAFPHEKIGKILKEMSGIKNCKYILKNKNNYNLITPFQKKTYIYNIETLNKALVKNHSKYIVMFDYKVKNLIYLKIVPAEYSDDYYVKGVRLYNETLLDVIKKLNRQRYAKIIYKGENFKIPNDASLVIKNINELKNYLDLTSYKTIKIVKVEDIDKNGIIDTITIKEKDNIVPQNFTPMQSIIHYLQNAIKAALRVKNNVFAKKTFIENIKSIIEDLKNLQ